MKIGTAIFLLLCLTGLVIGQNNVGLSMKHLYTGRFTIQNVNGLAQADYVQALNRTGVFSLTEDLFVGTSLLDYGAGPLPTGTPATTLGYAHIQIVNPTLTSSRNAFQFTLRTDLTAPNTTAVKANIYHVTISYIVIGDEFSGDTRTTLPTSYIFARNSEMVASTTSPVLVSFKSGALQSPFMHQQGTDAVCGAVKRNGRWVLETNCVKINALLFITGIQYVLPTTNTGSYSDSIGTATADNQISLTDTTKAKFSTTTSYGLNVPVSATNVLRTQYSMVVMAFRQYDSAVYPAQSVLVNDFIANTYVQAGFTRISPNQVVITGSPDSTIIPYFTNTNPYDPNAYSDRFCGLSLVKQTTTDRTKGLGFQLVNLDLENSVGQLSSKLLATTTIDGSSTTAGDTAFSYNCLYLAARTPTCTQSLTRVDINAANYVKPTAQNIVPETASSPVTVTIQDLGSTPLYDSTKDPNYLGNAINLAKQTSVNSGTFTVTYVFEMLGTPVVGPYQGALFVTNTVPTSGIESFNVQVFGTTVVDDTSSIAAEKLYHFAFINSQTTNNQVVITYTLRSNTTINQQLDFILVRNNQVMTQSGQCVTTCPAVSGASVGINYQTTPPTCVQCSIAQNLAFDPSTSECVCKPGFVLNTTSGQCQRCAIQLCATCTISSLSTDTCTECMPNTVNTTSGAVTTCLCRAGFYKSTDPSNPGCLTCQPGCATCNDGLSCATCLSTTTRKTAAYLCACLDGYYEAGLAQCQKCSPQCLTCGLSPTNCLSCNRTANFNLTGSTCSCADGYYLKVIDGSPVCLKCDVGCATCYDDASKCLTCVSDAWIRNTDGTCVCKFYLYYIKYANLTTQAICVNTNCTQIHPYCVNCGISFTGSPVCKTCDPAFNVVPSADQKTCVCKAGYVAGANGACLPCLAFCQTCTATGVCSACAVGSTLTSNGCTPCASGTYVATIGNVLICTPCDPTCATCVGAANNCTSCRQNYVYNPSVSTTTIGSCVCPTGKYLSGPDCIQCMLGCLDCTNATNCAACQTGFLPTVTPNGVICTVNCASGFYPTGSSCLACSENCATCRSDFDCVTCKSPYKLLLGACVSECPTGFILYSTGECLACSPSCASCSGTPDNCISCPANMILYNARCVNNCPAGSYFTGTGCLPCSQSCLTCTTTDNKCLTCPVGRYLFNDQCWVTCPTYLVGTVCSSTCPPGRYFNGTLCAPCNTTCVLCDSYPACLTCRSPLVSYKGICLNACPATNTLLLNGVCYDCDSSCAGCTGDINSCVQCAAGAYRLGTRCYQRCPQQYYNDASTMTCKKCDADCRVCTGPGKCVTCTNGTAAVNGFCAGACGPNCLTCNGGVCTQCAVNYFWNGIICDTFCPVPSTGQAGYCVCPAGTYLYRATCVSQCPTGFININNQCRACASPCKTCSTTVQTCQSCITGYNWDPINKKCIQIINCEAGKYPSPYGCRFICPQGNYYLDSACYQSQCPPGYNADDLRRICTRKQNPVGCTQPYFQQDGDCVLTCSAGFYPNPDTRVCTSCSANCLVCSGISTCTSCATGFTPSNGVCVLLGDPCPTGSFRSNYGCVATCPYGTVGQDGYCIRRCGSGLFYYDGGCYQTCPTNLQTLDGCVIVCPVGFTKQGTQCVQNPIQTCSAGQYYNSAVGACDNCRYPCSSCSGSAIFCTGCVASFSLRANTCVSETSCPAGSYPTFNGCARCAVKCATCIDLNICSSCAPGYTNTGSDCVQSATTLRPVSLQVQSVTKRDSTVFVQIRPSILPNNLPSTISSQILLFASSVPLDSARVNMWVDNGIIYVAITHAGIIPTYDAVFILNSNVMANLYASLGYTTSNTFVQTQINNNLPLAPASLVIPPTAAFSRRIDGDQLERVYRTQLNSLASKAVKQIRVRLP